LEPLHPQYVSSVDSGNLVGSLFTLQAGLAELKQQPVLSPHAFQGLQDTFRVLTQHVSPPLAPDLAQLVHLLEDNLGTLTADPPQTPADATSALDQIHGMNTALLALLPADAGSELHYWAHAFDRQSRSIRDELEYLLAGHH